MIINSAIVVMPYEEYKEAWSRYLLTQLPNPDFEIPYIHPDLQDQS